MNIQKLIETTLNEFLNEEGISFDKLNDIIYDPEFFHIFDKKIVSYHAGIESGLIVKFYLKEFLKYYDINDLSKIKSWDEFIKSIYNMWDKKKNSNQEIVYRRGKLNDEMFFSNNIYVASVYGGVLNAYILNFKNPYIIDCKESDWFDIEEPEIMKDVSYDGTVSTDNVVEYIKDEKLNYDGVIFLNLYEGSGAGGFGASTVYVSLNKNTVINLTNN